MNFNPLTPRPSRRIAGLLAVPALLAAAGLLAGCSSGAPANSSASAASSESAVTVNADARAMLPKDIADSGELKLTAPFTFPPYAYLTEANQMTGSDYEIGNEVAERLGLKPSWSRVKSFEALVPSIQNGRFDATFNAMSSNADRAKVVTLVEYQQGTWSILVQKGNPTNVDPNDLCGARSGGVPGAGQVIALQNISAQCVTAGKKPIALTNFQAGDEPIAALASGRMEVYIDFTVRSEDLVRKQPEKLEIIHSDKPVYAPAKMAVLSRPNAPGLAKAIEAVMKDMHDDGKTLDIYKKFQISDDSLIEPALVPESLRDAG